MEDTELENVDSALTASEILRRVENVYAEAASYMDTGRVESVFLDTAGNTMRVVIKPFTTAFLRPDRLRFEYGVEEGDEIRDRFIIWMNGEDVKTLWELTGGSVEASESLSLAIAAATGVSSGSANRIPRLLSNEVNGRSILEEKEPELVAEKDDADSSSCYLVKTARETLWIRKQTFLISRVDELRSFEKCDEHDAFTVNRVTTYMPEIDRVIPDEKFDFG